MRKRSSLVSLAILVTALVCLASTARWGMSAAGVADEKEVYVCPPCGSEECDRRVFDKPGSCPLCGMRLVKKDQIKSVAILVFDGVQIIDYAGPYEVFGQAGFRVYTVSEKAETLTTNMGMRVTPNYSFETAPRPNILLIPGGGVDGQMNNPAVIKWVQDKAKEADYVLSVCNGAFILARTGLLDGLTATTFYGLLDAFKEVAPKTEIISDQRYVDNGKIITTAGLSSGIDGSLYVVSKVLGRGQAQAVALNMEYNWQQDSTYARAAFADKHLRGLRRVTGADWELLNTAGGRDEWESKWQVATDSAAAALLEQINARLVAEGRWSRADAGKTKGDQSLWGFTDEKGKPWQGRVSVEPAADAKGKLVVALRVTRSVAK